MGENTTQVHWAFRRNDEGFMAFRAAIRAARELLLSQGKRDNIGAVVRIMPEIFYRFMDSKSEKGELR